jgi:diguanylate cyclase (GGDEF)-like protein
MPRLNLKPKSLPDIDHRKAVLSLRWLLVILASYLTLFSNAGSYGFPVVFGISVVFALSNIVFMVIPGQRFVEDNVQRTIAVSDIVFVAAILYLLRVPENYLYLALIAIIILAVISRDFRLVLFSLLVVSILFGTFTYFRLFGFQRGVDIEQFSTLSLFFVVTIFYVFLSDRLTQDGKMADTMMEETRMAEVMVEMTRALSSSLNTEDVLYSIVFRLHEVLEAEDCSIFRIDPKTGTARMMKASKPEERNIEVKLDEYPEIKQAFTSRRILYIPDAKPKSIIAIPMVVNESVLGLIDVRGAKIGRVLAQANTRFLDVMASTAANALRNAQLFEEVEQRARTDYLTGLPNHRFFQAMLAVELGRAQRHNRPLSLLMIDLDFLKSVNDRFGHPSGDVVIRTIAETIRKSCREIDFAARYGGEEFTVILPDTSVIGAVQAADRIRENVATQQFPGIGSITASIGVSNYPVNALSKEDLIRVADQALYVAKKDGRDRVAHFDYKITQTLKGTRE